MKRIDFFGVPGVGKSTIFQSLVKDRHRRWRTVREAKIDAARKRACSHERSPINLLKAIGSYIPGFEVADLALLESTIAKNERELLWQKRTDWHDFFRVCADTITADKERDPLALFLGARGLLTVLTDTAVLEHYDTERAVVFDESLCQKVFNVLPISAHRSAGSFLRYFDHMPLPDAVIYFFLPSEEVVERIDRRSDRTTILKHRGMSKSELLEETLADAEVSAKGVEVLTKRGVSMCAVDVSQPIVDSARQIHEHICSMKS